MAMYKRLQVLTFIAVLACSGAATAATVTVFETNFDEALPAEISPGTATLAGVQGYAGLGPAGNQFGGNFLRSATGNTVTLQLDNLPSHDTITLEFLFAAIDSLDGTGTFPSGDYFRIVFDGNVLFSESFANALEYQHQSYVAPPGVELARRVDLGFGGPGGYYTDSAYNLGADPRFAGFAHTGSSATIEFFIYGEGIQSLGDESWAMDNLRVGVTTLVPAPAGAWLLGSGLLGLIGVARRRRSKTISIPPA
jgi:hypothetical protein